MIDRSNGPGGDPRAMTAGGLLRLAVAACTVVAVQVSLVDPIQAPLLRHLDLPLAVASVLVLARPQQSTIVGLAFGLAVDASGHRLFGLHCIAYAVLGPIAVVLPVPGWRRAGAIIAWRAGAQGLAATVVVAFGLIVAGGGPPPGVVAKVAQTAMLTGLIAVPLSRWLGADAPAVGRGRTLLGSLRAPAGPPPRPGPIRPIGP